MQLVGRKWSVGGEYRYGFNGKENDNEIKGEGNSYTAEFWEYDARIGRRWNIDQVYKHSPYVAFGGNPIAFSDPLGLDSIHFNRHVRTFYPGGGRKPQGSSSFGINIVPSDGPDVFLYNVSHTTINSKGQSETTNTTTVLHPEDRESAAGMTRGLNLYFDGLITTERKNYDWESIGKLMYADKEFNDYLEKRNPAAAGWRNEAGSFTLMEGVMPAAVQSGLGAYLGFRMSVARTVHKLNIHLPRRQRNI